jgi:hypothetical protein
VGGWVGRCVSPKSILNKEKIVTKYITRGISVGGHGVGHKKATFRWRMGYFDFSARSLSSKAFFSRSDFKRAS